LMLQVTSRGGEVASPIFITCSQQVKYDFNQAIDEECL